jgi:tryptophanyl-tRNA synthetase
MRERYHALMADPAGIEAILQAGAHKARAEATPFMGELRQAVGLRNLGTRPAAPAKAKAAKNAAPAFKQYREKDGLFYFKLQDAEARVLLQSQGFESPRDAAQMIAALQKDGLSALALQQGSGQVQPPPGVETAEVAQALKFFAEASAS